MKRVATFLALPHSDRMLVLEAAATLAIVRGALHLFTIDQLRAWAGRIERGTKPLDRIVWAVRTASRRVPGTTCLGSALTLQRMLSMQGYASELCIGVACESPKGIVAHAWLVHEGRVLIGEEEQANYTQLTAWRVNGSRSDELKPG